jgi:hypothetical protein
MIDNQRYKNKIKNYACRSGRKSHENWRHFRTKAAKIGTLRHHFRHFMQQIRSIKTQLTIIGR